MTKKRSHSLAFLPRKDLHYALNLAKNSALNENEFDSLYRKLRTNTIKSIKISADLDGDYTPSVLKAIELADKYAVEEIELTAILIGDKGITLLQGILKNNTYLRKLGLSYTELIDKQISALSEGLRDNNTLTGLDLSSNDITALGMRDLNKALENNTALTALDLSYNPCLEDEGIKAFCPTLEKNKTLKVLNLRQCDLSDIGLESIINALKNNPNGIKDLNVSDNELSDPVPDFVSSFLKTNPSIKMDLTNYALIDYSR